eukprot:8400942-Pyramimonas_sp.AAC.1
MTNHRCWRRRKSSGWQCAAGSASAISAERQRRTTWGRRDRGRAEVCAAGQTKAQGGFLDAPRRPWEEE